jgi:hypothetical protein
MWMDAYVQDILIRQRSAEAEERATRHHLLRRTKFPRHRQNLWALVRWLAGAPSHRPPTRLEEVTSP